MHTITFTTPAFLGFVIMKKVKRALRGFWDSWVKARTEYAKQYVIHDSLE